jgi:hypothetical protein
MSMETNRPTEHRSHGSGGSHGTPGSGYEQRDAHIPDLLKFGFWMAVVIFLTMVAMRYTFNYLDRTQVDQPAASPFTRAREIPPSPRLQAAPRKELKDYCDAQETELNSYGWVDQRLKVVHIPIEQAMDLVLKNGLPVRATAPTGAAAVNVPPAMSSGGEDLQGQCGYLSKSEDGNASGAAFQAAELGKIP